MVELINADMEERPGESEDRKMSRALVEYVVEINQKVNSLNFNGKKVAGFAVELYRPKDQAKKSFIRVNNLKVQFDNHFDREGEFVAMFEYLKGLEDHPFEVLKSLLLIEEQMKQQGIKLDS